MFSCSRFNGSTTKNTIHIFPEEKGKSWSLLSNPYLVYLQQTSAQFYLSSTPQFQQFDTFLQSQETICFSFPFGHCLARSFEVETVLEQIVMGVYLGRMVDYRIHTDFPSPFGVRISRRALV